MHVGHCRGAVVGDALANLLAKAGYARHQGILHQRCRRAGRGARLGGVLALPAGDRHAADRGRNSPPQVPGGLQYRGDYLVPVGEALAQRTATSLAAPDGGIAEPDVWLDTVRDFADRPR